jgi:hypothetical protein
MNKKILIMAAIISSTMAFSQEEIKFPIHSVIRTEDHTCKTENIKKKIQLDVWYEDKWLTLMKATIPNCENTYPLKVLKNDRKFKLTVEAKGYESTVSNFEIKAGTTERYDVEEIILKKKK